MRWLILCNDCAEEVDEETVAGIFEAKFGPAEGEDIEGSILVCPPWGERRDNVPAMQFFCDECGTPVAVAHSSQWFIDNHRKERDEQIGRT